MIQRISVHEYFSGRQLHSKFLRGGSTCIPTTIPATLPNSLSKQRDTELSYASHPSDPQVMTVSTVCRNQKFYVHLYPAFQASFCVSDCKSISSNRPKRNWSIRSLRIPIALEVQAEALKKKGYCTASQIFGKTLQDTFSVPAPG
jgi:hypothetical protein